MTLYEAIIEFVRAEGEFITTNTSPDRTNKAALALQSACEKVEGERHHPFCNYWNLPAKGCKHCERLWKGEED